MRKVIYLASLMVMVSNTFGNPFRFIGQCTDSFVDIRSENTRNLLSEIFPKLWEKRGQLVAAINQSNFDMVKDIISGLSKDDITTILSDNQNKGLLFIAAEKDNVDIIRYLVEQGAEVNTYGEFGYSLLTFAVNSGSKSIVKFLVHECNININSADKSGDTPLSIAVENRNQAMVKFLVHECNANVNLVDERGSTPLILATVDNNKQMARCLIKECNADVNISDRNGNSPLTFAILNQNKTIAEFLIENGADINKENKKGDSPLNCAIRDGDSSMLRTLVKATKKFAEKEKIEQIPQDKKEVQKEEQSMLSNVTSKKKKKKKKKKKIKKQISMGQIPLNSFSSNKEIQKSEEVSVKSDEKTEKVNPFINTSRRSSISNGLLPYVDFYDIGYTHNGRRYSISNGMLSFENDIFDE